MLALRDYAVSWEAMITLCHLIATQNQSDELATLSPKPSIAAHRTYDDWA